MHLEYRMEEVFLFLFLKYLYEMRIYFMRTPYKIWTSSVKQKKQTRAFILFVIFLLVVALSVLLLFTDYDLVSSILPEYVFCSHHERMLPVSLDCPFFCVVFTQCCQCLWIVRSWLSLRFSLTFINRVQMTGE